MNDKAYIHKYVEDGLTRRIDQLGAKPESVAARREEAAFLAGAATALQAVFGKPGDDKMTEAVPVIWVLWPMSGRSVVQELRKRSAAK